MHTFLSAGQPNFPTFLAVYSSRYQEDWGYKQSGWYDSKYDLNFWTYWGNCWLL